VATTKKSREGHVVMKEKLVDDYNKNMGFVNKNKVTVQHTLVRKSHKWTTKVAFHMIEEALFNVTDVSEILDCEWIHALENTIIINNN